MASDIFAAPSRDAGTDSLYVCVCVCGGGGGGRGGGGGVSWAVVARLGYLNIN